MHVYKYSNIQNYPLSLEVISDSTLHSRVKHSVTHILIVIKPGVPAAGQSAPGFFKLILCGSSVCVCLCMCVCVCVCPPPMLLIISGVMWRDIDPIRLVKQVL